MSKKKPNQNTSIGPYYELQYYSLIEETRKGITFSHNIENWSNRILFIVNTKGTYIK